MNRIGFKRPISLRLLEARPAAAIAIAAALAAVNAPAAGQTPMARAEAQAIRPIAAPLPMRLGNVDRFRFATEVANLGVAVPNWPARVVAEGSGTVSAGVNSGGWRMAFERLTIDGAPIASSGPLASVFVNLGGGPTGRRSYSADYQGLRSSPQAAYSPMTQLVLGRMVETSAYALFLPPPTVGGRAPVLDMNAALARLVSRLAPGGQIVQPAAPAVAAGIVRYHGYQAVLVRQRGPLVVRMYNLDLALESESDGIIDASSSLPLFMRVEIKGQGRLQFLNGPVNIVIRTASAVEGMPDPLEALRPLTPLPGQAPPPSAAAPPSFSAPAPPPAPRPTPQAAPPAPAPAATAPPATAPAGVGPARQQRLQILKGLYDQGLISKEQYEQRQREILANP